MGMRFEWADIDRPNAQIWNDIELAEVADDGDVVPGTVGISADTGSNGCMLWGERDALIAWLEDAARRLRGGEGLSGYGEEREFVLPGQHFLLQDADGGVYVGEEVQLGWLLPGNALSFPEVDGDPWPTPDGGVWQVMDEPRTGVAADGRCGFVIRTRKVLNQS